MTRARTVVLNGDLGSGKTTVSVMLAERLGVRRVSIGDLYRRMAAEHGMTALQFNLHSRPVGSWPTAATANASGSCPRYGVDKTRLHNYDLVCDTTRAAPEDVVARIVEVLEAPSGSTSALACYLDPSRVHRTATTGEGGEIVVRHQASDFVAVQGNQRLGAAIRRGETLTPMVLAG